MLYLSISPWIDISSKETKFVIIFKNIPTKKIPSWDNFGTKLYQRFEEEIRLILYKTL